MSILVKDLETGVTFEFKYSGETCQFLQVDLATLFRHMNGISKEEYGWEAKYNKEGSH